MNQRGVTFLEIIVVIAILMVTSMLVAPNIQDWRQKRALESDFNAVLAQIDYLKTRARNIGGTGLLICSGAGTVLSYKMSTNPQRSISVVDDDAGAFTQGIVENPSATNAAFNVLSGNTKLVSSLCSGGRGIFTSFGESGVENSGNQILIEIYPQADQTKYGSYRITFYQSTGFIKKEKSKPGSSSFQEVD
jgi:Tfp pilus assembly protein FimT